MNVQRLSRYLAMWVVAGLLLACTYHLLLRALGLGHPWNTFLFAPEDRFNDWFATVQTAKSGAPYTSASPGAYFPFAYITALIGAGWTRTGSIIVFQLISAALIALGVTTFWSLNVSRSGERPPGRRYSILLLWLVSAFASYPYIFGFDRGNLDLWIGGLVLLYVGTLTSRHAWAGAVALGAATAMKGYPVAFILLGVSRRQFFSSAIAIATATILTVISLAAFKGGITFNWNAFREAQHAFGEAYALGTTSLSHSSDPYNGIRAVTAEGWQIYKDINGIQGASPPLPVKGNAMAWRALILDLYTLISFCAATLTAIFVLFSNTPAWRRVTAIAIVALLFPNVANDYKLILLLPAVFSTLIDTDPDPRRKTAFWLLILPLVPNSYLYVHGYFGLSMFLNPIILIALWWTVIHDRDVWQRMWQKLVRRDFS